jgi:hypothetical protein
MSARPPTSGAPLGPPSGVLPPRTTRRGFLRVAGATAALASLARLRALPAAAAAAEAGERFFDARETEILTRIAERVCDTGVPGAPRLRDTATVATIDAFCRGLDPRLTAQLPLALWLFEWGPCLFELTFKPFTRMSDAERDASLRAWRASRLAIRRQAFLAVRNLCLLGWYSQPEAWALVGYRGPLVGAGARP